MRNLMKLTAVLFFIIATASVNAQTLKFGHIDLQGLIQVMPERATAETEFNKFQTDIEDVFGQMQKEYQQKLAELQQLGDAASEVKRNAKVTEIQDLQQRMQNYQSTAQQQLQQKQTDLLKPVFDKADSVIAVVAKEKGLIYVFDSSTNVVLYKSNQSVDLLPLVKEKLGIK
ncbi:MAG TPA: OmpH family outer membrane protein [Draconibacterium sp.]|nr:OmpH family outer membrane protein [Draconibacterium sp.]